MEIPKTVYAHLPGESVEYDTLLSCSRCATCLPACPSYSATLLESCSPRGRVQLLRALAEETLSPSPRIQQALHACLDCRACETVCPNGLHPGQMATRARGEMQRGMTFTRWMKRLVLGPGLSYPAVISGGLAAVRLFYQRTGLQHLLRHAGLLRPWPALKRLEHFLPPIPAKTVRASLPEIVPAIGPKRGRVGFFLGCAMNTLFADTTRCSISSLQRLGFEVVIPRKIVCCGAPQVSLGELDQAKAMARHNLAAFEGLDYIITDCAACGAELKHYHELLDDKEVASFSSRVRDYAEFVAPLLPEMPKLDIGPVTYHAPCHLAHAQGVCAPPKQLLRDLCVEYRELAEHDRCCGSAGVYWMTHPEISDNSQARKIANIRASGATTVVTANPGCLLQIMAGRNENDNWQIKHISEITDMALRENECAAAVATKDII